MSKITRRDFIRYAGAGVAATWSVFGPSRLAAAQSAAHVVVIGGGFGGATCARYLKRSDPGIKVTLVEPNKQFITCPFSNYVIADWRTIRTITHPYTRLQKHGIDVVHDTATEIDPIGKKIGLKGGKSLAYDRLVVSPGIDLKWGAIVGYDEKAAEIMPHAWKAGPQTLLLRKKLLAMKNGDTFIMVAPPNPFRCPPGPYERASVIAYYLKNYKPRSKILLLDPKEGFSKQGLFTDGWNKLYPGMVEWVPGAKGGKVSSVDTKTMTVEAELDKHKAAVVNVIPPQMAGKIARDAGLTDDSGWCPVDPRTFESKKHKGVHVIGDAAIAAPMPKSGFAANSQAKATAAAIAAELRGRAPPDSIYTNTCYSLLAPDYGISVANVYRLTADGIKEAPSSGVSPKDADAAFRADEAKYAAGWYASIVADVWG